MSRSAVCLLSVLHLCPVVILVAASADPQFSVSPKLVRRGQSYTLLVSAEPCADDVSLAKAKLETANSAFTISDQTSVGACKLTAKIEVSNDADYGPVNVRLVSTQPARGLPLVLTLEVVGLSPEPIPPGLTPQVDVMWKILPWRQVADSYGRKVASQYFAVEIGLGNDTGYPVLLETIGFLHPEVFGSATPVPNDAYNIVRSTIERSQETGTRALVFGGVQAVSVITAGAAPFVKNPGSASPVVHVGSKAQYGFWMGLTNPLLAALNYVYPDKTVRQLIALDTRIFRGGMIVKNNEAKSIYTFISRDLIEDRSCPMGMDGPGNKGSGNRLCRDRKNFDPNAVRSALGQLVIIGSKIEYLNRLRVVSGAPPEGAVPPPVLDPVPADRRKLVQGQSIDLTLTGHGLIDLTPAVPKDSGLTASIPAPDPNGRAIKLKVTAPDDAKVGDQDIELSNRAGGAFLTVSVAASKPEGTPAPDRMNRGASIAITITGKNLLGAKLEAPAGSSGISFEKSENTNEKLVMKVTAASDAKLSADKLIINHFGATAEVSFKLN